MVRRDEPQRVTLLRRVLGGEARVSHQREKVGDMRAWGAEVVGVLNSMGGEEELWYTGITFYNERGCWKKSIVRLLADHR